jgi:hypothetical protein
LIALVESGAEIDTTSAVLSLSALIADVTAIARRSVDVRAGQA